jgi:AAA domain
MLISPQVRIGAEDPELNASQLRAVDDIFLSQEKISALDGIAGAGKTRTLAVIREGAEIDGGSKGSRRHPVLHRNSVKPGLKHRSYRSI